VRGGRPAALPVLNCLHELALAHPGSPGDTHGLRHPLQFRQEHGRQCRGSATVCPPGHRLGIRPRCPGRVWSARGGRGLARRRIAGSGDGRGCGL